MTYTVTKIDADPATRATLLGLNNENARETSPLGLPKLDDMIAAARVAVVVQPGIAFLLAFEKSANYDSPNFLWFRDRFDDFFYIDRVIVGRAHRRLGLGRLLYEDLFRRAEKLACRQITCEVNVRPPNPVSDAFHARFGFSEVGMGESGDGTKSVRYLMRRQ